MDAMTGARTPTSANPLTSAKRTSFPLVGTKDRPDPRIHAWREDLADVALAGQVIASHYAAPVARTLKTDSVIRSQPDSDADIVVSLEGGADFLLLDSRGEWAWGYAGPDKLVGYLPTACLT